VAFVLDTNVVSALRVTGRHREVEDWARSVPLVEQFTTVLTIAEIERGVAARERSDAAQGAVLRRWLDAQVLPAFAGRILPFDLEAARVLGTYRVPERAPLDDAIIAAIAASRAMTVVTRNTRHYEPLGVDCWNPWQGPRTREV